MGDDGLRKVEWATWYHCHTNLQHGKAIEDIATYAAMNHVLERKSICHC